ncbi:MAG TPA: sensor domain-containing diguanylate cyclase [Trichocoleus sp.]
MSIDKLSFSETIQPFQGFQEAAQHVLQFLHDRLGFSLWMVTRTEGDDWIVLIADDNHYGLRNGTVLRWSESFCARMVAGLGPQIAPRSADVDAYATAPIGQQVSISAYIGIPLHWPDGSLFGTLCAIDPHPQPEIVQAELPLLHLQARLLSSLIAADLNTQEIARSLQQARQEAQVDFLTGLYNRRGWEALLAVEEERCKTYGSPALAMVIDIDDLKQINDSQGHTAGDAIISTAAECLRQSVRSSDIVARLGGDEFAILMVELRDVDKSMLVRRIQSALRGKGISASIGWAVRSPTMTLAETIEKADAHMYLCKRQRKAACYK